MRETDVWDRVTDTVYTVFFTTEREDGDAFYVSMERIVTGNDDGEDVEVTLDFETEERVRDVIAQRVHDGGML